MEVLSYIDEIHNWHDLPTSSMETEQRKKIDIPVEKNETLHIFSSALKTKERKRNIKDYFNGGRAKKKKRY